MPIDTVLYGSNNYRPRHPEQALCKRGFVYYCNKKIPVNDILCIREVPESRIHPKSIVTIVERNPDTDLPIATEYEYSGSQGQWINACKKAQEEGIAHIDFWA